MPRESTSSFVFSLCASAFSATALVFAFPDFDVEWLAWFGLVPFFLAISGRRMLQAIISSYLFGAVFVTGVCRWIFEVERFSLPHYLLVVAYLGAFSAIFGIVFTCIQRRRGAAAAFLTAPFLWVSLEYARSNASFLSLPWGLMAHTQHLNYPYIQISAITGAYGVSFLLVAVNAALAFTIRVFVNRKELSAPSPFRAPTKSSALLALGVVFALAGVVYFYGKIVLSKPVAGRRLKVTVVQGNIDQERKWDPKSAGFIQQRYSDLTRAATRDKPDLIVWPEAATPGFVLDTLPLMAWMRGLVTEAGTFFLIGSSERPKFSKDGSVRQSRGNTALYYSPDGKILSQYLKIHLVPFAEYLPYEGTIPWPEFIARKEGNWDIPGEKMELFPIHDHKIGVVICWESIFPDFFRKFIKGGASFMINITNEGWFRNTIPYQYLAMNVFRAVENRVYIARAANVGISCFIDAHGRVYGRLRKNNADLYVAGYLTEDVYLNEDKTFYTRYGDVFAFANIFATILMCAVSFLSRPKHERLVHTPRR